MSTRWEPSSPWSGRLSLNREPTDADDLIAWVRTIQHHGAYRLNEPRPDQWAEEFTDGVYDTWQLLHRVAASENWLDVPSRPEPDRRIEVGFGAIESHYSRTFVNQHLNGLLEYCQAKLPKHVPSPQMTLSDIEIEILKAVLKKQYRRAEDIAADIGRSADSPFRQYMASLQRHGYLAKSAGVYQVLDLGRQVLNVMTNVTI
jgi:hypothetical protein